MEGCPDCNSSYKRNSKSNQEIPMTNSAAKNRNVFQQCGRVLHLPDKSALLQFVEHKISEKNVVL